jgi:hypothetical protein
MCADTERRDGFGPQGARLSVRALIVTDVAGPAHAEPALVGDHLVMPRRQSGAQRRGIVGADA